MKLADAYVEIGARTGKLDKGLGGVRQRLSRIRTGMAGLVKTGAIMFAGLTAAAGLTVRAFAQQEEAEAKLEAVLRATGHAAGFSANQLKKRAAELQQMTGIGDESIISMQAILATFKDINGARFDNATKAILDMNTVLGTGPESMRTMAIQVGKALNDPLQGLTALRRSGVSFTEEQKKLIKTLVETGQKSKAQAIILKELKNEFGGAAEAVGKTFGGEMKKLKADFGDVMEKIGEMISELVKLGGGFDSLREKIRKIPEHIQNFIDVFVLGSLNMRKKFIDLNTFMESAWEGTIGSLNKGWALWQMEGLTTMEKLKIGMLEMQKGFSGFMARFTSRIAGLRGKFWKAMGLSDEDIKRGNKNLRDWVDALTGGVEKIKKEIAKISPEYAKFAQQQDEKTKERIMALEKAAEKEKGIFDGIIKKYKEGMTKRKIDALLTDEDIEDSNAKTQEAITKKQKKESDKRSTMWLGIADFWKKIQETIFEAEPKRRGEIPRLGMGAGAGAKEAPIILTFKPEFDRKLEKMVTEQEKQNRILKDGINVKMAEASMAFGG